MATRVSKKAAVAMAAVSLVGAFEGLRTYAYRDPVGIPTICFGETRGVKMGDKATVDECKGMLSDALANEYAVKMEKCIRNPENVPDTSYIAFLSFTYNVGSGAFCKSTLARKLNAGDLDGACYELKKWDKAMGIRLPGLTKRRAAEMALCLQKKDL